MVTVNGPITARCVTVDSPCPDVCQAFHGNVADHDKSTHSHLTVNPHRIRTLKIDIPIVMWGTFIDSLTVNVRKLILIESWFSLWVFWQSSYWALKKWYHELTSGSRMHGTVGSILLSLFPSPLLNLKGKHFFDWISLEIGDVMAWYNWVRWVFKLCHISLNLNSLMTCGRLSGPIKN